MYILWSYGITGELFTLLSKQQQSFIISITGIKPGWNLLEARRVLLLSGFLRKIRIIEENPAKSFINQIFHFLIFLLLFFTVGSLLDFAGLFYGYRNDNLIFSPIIIWNTQRIYLWRLEKICSISNIHNWKVKEKKSNHSFAQFIY